MKKQNVVEIEPTSHELHNEIALAFINIESGKANLTKAIQTEVKTKAGRLNVADAAKDLYLKYGKRTRIPKDQGGGFTASTKFDSFNTLVQDVTGKAGQKYKPVCNKEGEWVLEPVKQRAPSERSKSKTLDAIRSEYVEICSQLTADQKESELELLRVLMGLEPEQKADITPIKGKKKAA